MKIERVVVAMPGAAPGAGTGNAGAKGHLLGRGAMGRRKRNCPALKFSMGTDCFAGRTLERILHGQGQRSRRADRLFWQAICQRAGNRVS